MSDDDAKLPDAWIEFGATFIYDLHRAGILYKIDDMTDEEVAAAVVPDVIIVGVEPQDLLVIFLLLEGVGEEVGGLLLFPHRPKELFLAGMAELSGRLVGGLAGTVVVHTVSRSARVERQRL